MVKCYVCWKEHSPVSPRQFHSFPRDTERREKWYNSIGRVITAFKHARICSDHFIDDDYYNCGTPVQSRRLKKTAIPTVFTHRVCKNIKKDSTNNSKSKNRYDLQISMEHAYAMDIQYQSDMDIQATIDIQQSATHIQDDNIVVKPIIVQNNNTIRKNKQRNIGDKVFLRTGRYNIECIRRTDFVTNQAWMKFIKYINYNRYLHKHTVAKTSRLQKKFITMESVLQTLKSKNLVTNNVNTLKLNC